MFFDQAETDIATQISTVLGAGIEVEVMPQTQAEFKRPFEKRRVEVCYKKSTYQGPRIPHQIVQDEIAEFEIVMIARLRRGSEGVFDLMQQVFTAIIGFKPTNYRQIYAKDIEVEKFEDNLWYYVATVACESTLVENFAEDEGAVITAINFEQI